MPLLTHSQLNALSYVQKNARQKESDALSNITKLLQDASLPFDCYSSALSSINNKAPIDVSFHPDRPDANGQTVVEGLLHSGLYKSQFETGLSNGGLTAYKGGSRDRWEETLFGGAYQVEGVKPNERPKYGALNLMHYWDGACPRFGSCYFRLKPTVAERCTFSYGDSSTNPSDVAGLSQFVVVMQKLMADVVDQQAALGSENLKLKTLLEHISNQSFSYGSVSPNTPPGRTLDNCIEVHSHGNVNLANDVAWLAVDGSFKSTRCGEQLVYLSEKFRFPIHWNPAFELATDDVPADFRGPTMVPLAAYVAPDGVLNAAKIGKGVVDLRNDHGDWTQWGSAEETLQYLKQLWHVLVTFGYTKVV